MPGSSGTADIETGADTLLSFLEEKSKWPVSRIAEDLGVPEDTVKKWAKALEKSGLVEIKYSVLKGMVLEYSSEKSYEELNEGRSEMSLEADEIEIEAEEVEEVSEAEGDVAETKHEEANNEDGEETDDENKHEESEDQELEQESSEEQESERLDNDLHEEEKKDEGKLEAKTDKAKLKDQEEAGKEKLKNELEELEKKDEGDNVKRAKVKAGKAKIKHPVKKSTSKEEEDVERVRKKVESKSNGSADSHETGDSLDEALENIKDLGDLLKDEEMGNGPVYSKMEKEMAELKKRLQNKEIDGQLRKKVSEAMVKVEDDIKNAEEPPGIMGRLKSKLRL